MKRILRVYGAVLALVTCNVNSATHLLRESTAHATVDP
jgi:hypothetical protein